VVTLTDLLALFLRNGGEDKATANLISSAELAQRRESDLRSEVHDDQKALEHIKKLAADAKHSPSQGDKKRIAHLEARLAKASSASADSSSASSSTSSSAPTHANPAIEKESAHIADLSRRVEQLSEADAASASHHKPRTPQVLIPPRSATPTDSGHLSPRPTAPMSPMASLAHASPHVARPPFIEEI
jgi:hypothetical protein